MLSLGLVVVTHALEAIRVDVALDLAGRRIMEFCEGLLLGVSDGRQHAGLLVNVGF